jgi:hypothetical protein
VDRPAFKAEVARAAPYHTTLAEDYESATLDLGDWKRLKCNRATRSANTAITDAEWGHAEVKEPWVEGKTIDVGLDVASKWDATAFVPLWVGAGLQVARPAEDHRAAARQLDHSPGRDQGRVSGARRGEQHLVGADGHVERRGHRRLARRSGRNRDRAGRDQPNGSRGGADRCG